jgi:hypothetical protein
MHVGMPGYMLRMCLDLASQKHGEPMAQWCRDMLCVLRHGCRFTVQTLAYNAGMFSTAQVLRRDGTAPAALGIADDLPDRMAYQQLNILAGMAGKVS